MATDDEKTKFSLYLPAGTVAAIDADAAALEISRSEWIRRSCDQTLHPSAPVETPADTRDTPAGAPVDTREIDALTARIAELERDIERARADALAAVHIASLPPLLRRRRPQHRPAGTAP